jgi:hypothetical protein
VELGKVDRIGSVAAWQTRAEKLILARLTDVRLVRVTAICPKF